MRDEGVPLLAWGSSAQTAAFAHEVEGQHQTTAERVLDEAQGDDGDDSWLDLGRRWLRSRE